MSNLNNPDNFKGRVDFAAFVIRKGLQPSRSFDDCFENGDGDAVAAALVRRAKVNPAIAANLWRYLNRETAEAAFAKYGAENLTACAARLREQ